MAHAQPVSSFRQEPRVSIRGQRVDPVDEKVDVEGPPRYDVSLAEEVGFEPTEPCGSHAFQACRFGRSRTPPDNGARTEARHNDTTNRRHFRSTTAEVYMVARSAPCFARTSAEIRGSFQVRYASFALLKRFHSARFGAPATNSVSERSERRARLGGARPTSCMRSLSRSLPTPSTTLARR